MIEQTIYGATGGAVTFPTGSPVCSVGGVFFLASASDPTRSPAIGLLSHYSEQGNFNCSVAGSGFLTLKNWTNLTGTATLTPGSNYYLSTTPGKLTLTPVQAGAIASQLLGTAVTATTLQVNVVSPTVVVANIVSDTLQMPNTPAAGMVLKSGAGGIFTPQFPGMGMGTGGWLNVIDDFGAVGDGIADDTDALQNAFLAGWTPDFISSTDDRYRVVFLPPGTYRVTHPLVVPWYRRIQGSNRGLYGCIIQADPAFDVNWNIPFAPSAAYPGISRIPPAVLQSNTWAPDPTGAHRWQFNGSLDWPALPWSVGSFWNGGQIMDLKVDGNGVVGLNGIAIDSMAEHALLSNVYVLGCGGAGLWLTGACTGAHVENYSIWNCMDAAVKITTNPFWVSTGRVNPDGNFNGNTSGDVVFLRGSGDGNSPCYFFITQPTTLLIEGLKYESPYESTDNVFRFDVDPALVGTGTGINEGGRGIVTIISGNYQPHINVGPHIGDPDARTFIRIMTTGALDVREYIKPAIVLIGCSYYHPNVLQDDGFQAWANTLPGVTRIFGADGAAGDQVIPRALWVYSNDTNEYSGIQMHQFKIGGTTLTLPDGTQNHGT